MYMNPTLPAGGFLCSIQAFTHSMAFASMHIGSGPGVCGLSGMQVNPLLPLRNVRIWWLASMATMVASLATFAGAACMALAMSEASLGAFAAVAVFAFFSGLLASAANTSVVALAIAQ